MVAQIGRGVVALLAVGVVSLLVTLAIQATTGSGSPEAVTVRPAPSVVPSPDVAALTSTEPTPRPSSPRPSVSAPSAAASDAVRVDSAWVDRFAGATGITPVALQAYAAASIRLAGEQPGCRVGWNTLAGIGQVESGHGQGRLDAQGRSRGTIEGPALDGTGGNASITEDGSFDQARGPMQFIASTWRRWAADGDGDGSSDVDDVDDAALAAARYLCASGGDLTTSTGWSRAIFSYNHSDAYVAKVLVAANGYATAAG